MQRFIIGQTINPKNRFKTCGNKNFEIFNDKISGNKSYVCILWVAIKKPKLSYEMVFSRDCKESEALIFSYVSSDVGEAKLKSFSYFVER
jgi:hypothetical protein